MKLFCVLTLACLTDSQSYADIHLEFLEGAPKDKFVLTNEGSCQVKNAVIKIDLSGAAAGLIFDVTAAGAGVEVFQPLEITSGAEHFSTIPKVSDGDQSITLQLQNFGPNKVVAFTIDVDDTTGAREITVSDSEFDGVSVSATMGEQLFSATLQDRSEVRLDMAGCMT
ncbi:hypothetical protein [Falsihalocynthiibacter arcticus]|uniref:Aggregation factor core n=1 Tax=Falsihalocynthiibacter arcticus TaxID=1579316 RepID=A0A126V3Y7_9RHOB|nr:hypothetical protein [Falsihalocynthiibacter arcticus]AML53010.1 hypothetical protein RC74_18665 [Falsihalocynthiibacter arcticus]